MSYLDVPRIHFFGTFFANPSTINNTLTNYNLQPPLQLAWNPNGSAFFQFLNTRVSSVVGPDGKVLPTGSGDPITQAMVATPLSPQTKVAKIVDLDPDQQSITQLFGVVVTIALPGGQGGVTGTMAVAELRDLWFGRVPSAGNDPDVAASGVWQSILTDLQWSGLEQSAFLSALRAASPDRLSIKFNTDAYDDNSQSSTFNQGRLAGTIGPYVAGEPLQIVMGRRLIPVQNSPYWSAPFQLSRGGDRLIIDLGNSVPLNSVGGDVSGASTLNAVILAPQGPITLSTALDVSKSAYAVNSGVCEVPLTPDQAGLLATNPLGLIAAGDPNSTLLLNEPPDGRYVNVEPFSLRLNPGQSGVITLFAREFGEPLGGLALPIGFDAQQFDGANSPPTALNFPATVTTQPSGQVSIEIAVKPPRGRCPTAVRCSSTARSTFSAANGSRGARSRWVQSGPRSACWSSTTTPGPDSQP